MIGLSPIFLEYIMMNKPRNVSVSVIELPGELRVWNASFTIKGGALSKDGKIDEKARKALQKRLQKFIETIEFPENL